jgi:all-trans-retinol 13,14-reductase
MERNCVIIGAGLGGLSCGAILTRHGFKVTVLEQESHAGGCLQTFVRDGVRFETGMHFIGSAGRGELLDSLLRFLGIRGGLELHELDHDGYDIITYKGQDYPFRNGRDAFIEGLAEHFPGQKDNLVRYMDTVYKASAASSVESFNPARVMDSNDTVWHTRSVDSVIDGIVDDADLREILAGNQPLYAGVKGHTPFSLHAFITSFYNRSAWRIAGGSDNIARLLIERITCAGGSIKIGCKAVEIVCDETKATGVKFIVDGVEQMMDADYVISTIHPALTVGMVHSPLLRPAYKKRIQQLSDTIGVFELYLKFKTNTVPYMNANRFVYESGSIWGCDSYTTDDWPRGYLYMHQWPQGDSRYADAGVILAYMRNEELAVWTDTLTGRRGDDYREFKKRKAEKLLAVAAKRFPELGDGLERYYTSTPLTYRDYTGAVGGGLYGIAKDIELGQSGRVSYRTRVGNLFLAGQSVNSHGIMGVLVGSMVVCDSILGNGILYDEIIKASK